MFLRHRRQVRRDRAELLLHLRRDVAGNTLAIMAIALLPILLFVGSSVDTARIYMVKTRLQQACDAGALAGRKFMISNDSASLDANATAQANSFFNNNFKVGLFGTKSVVFTPSKSNENQVTAQASAVLPMTLTGMMGFGDQTISVDCEARYDVADTDVMFVLDTTGSMACPTSNPDCNAPSITYTRPDGTTGYYKQEAPGSKLSGLRVAVLKFYDTLTSAIDPETKVRYGFVTYTSTVNAGYAVTSVSPSYIVDTWRYNTRTLIGDTDRGWDNTSYYNLSQAECDARAGRDPVKGYYPNGAATLITTSWRWGTCTVNSQPLKPNWRYEKAEVDTSQYKLGKTIPDPSKITGATTKWQGCLEERDTTPSTWFDPNQLPPDLDPDLIPTSDATRWRPMWPDITYLRRGSGSSVYSGDSTKVYGDSSNTSSLTFYAALNIFAPDGYTSCGKPVQRLQGMTRDQVNGYVNAPDFVANGGTYHDTGMIWGTRLISPTGIFASDTAAWPGRKPPRRYIVFMTDGDMAPSRCIYGMYGIENYDQRVTNESYVSGCWQSSSMLARHYTRFLTECTAAKARNISVFVVAFGQTLTSQLRSCASPGQAFYASDNASLTTAFQTIAKQVAILRLSK